MDPQRSSSINLMFLITRSCSLKSNADQHTSENRRLLNSHPNTLDVKGSGPYRDGCEQRCLLVYVTMCQEWFDQTQIQVLLIAFFFGDQLFIKSDLFSNIGNLQNRFFFRCVKMTGFQGNVCQNVMRKLIWFQQTLSTSQSVTTMLHFINAVAKVQINWLISFANTFHLK